MPHLLPLTPVQVSDYSQLAWQLGEAMQSRSVEGTTITVVNGMQGLPQANLSGVEIYGANDTSRFLGGQRKCSLPQRLVHLKARVSFFIPIFTCSFF